MTRHCFKYIYIYAHFDPMSTIIILLHGLLECFCQYLIFKYIIMIIILLLYKILKENFNDIYKNLNDW